MGCVLLGLATNTCPGRNQHQRQGENGTPRARACGVCAGQDPGASSRAWAEGGGALRSVLGRPYFTIGKQTKRLTRFSTKKLKRSFMLLVSAVAMKHGL